MDRNRLRVASAVVHTATGQVAGISDIGVNRDRTEVAYQWDTIVDPDHRGKRLGMVLKTHNHRWLAQSVQGVRWVNTWNAASNTFMVAVNDALGNWMKVSLLPSRGINTWPATDGGVIAFASTRNARRLQRDRTQQIFTVNP